VHIVSVGHLMVDVLAQLPGPLSIGSDTPAPIRFAGGGAAANLAAWAVVAGARATFVGVVGDDALGRQAVTELVRAGVETRVATDAALPTGTCIVLIDGDLERTMIPSAGANDSATAPELPEAADWLCLSGYLLFHPATRPRGLAALAAARTRGWAVAVDAASAAPLAAFGAAEFLQTVGQGVVLLANEDEAVVLTGTTDPQEAAADIAAHSGSAVVKLGAAGAVWSDGSDSAAVSAADVVAADTTGSGDAFAAGFVTAGGRGTAALQAGVALAARAVGQLGARPPADLS
jgi:sugar/nucleoside kinase (ribokinase family)